MKKTLVAIAVTLASASANAATIYSNEGLTYTVNGDIQAQLRQKAGIDQDSDIEFDDIELKNYVTYEIDSSTTAFGRVDFGFKDLANNEDGGQAELEEAYLGMAFNNIALSFGKRPTAADDFGVVKAIEVDASDEDRFDAVATSGDDVIRFDADLNNVTLIAAYEMKAEGSDKVHDSYVDFLVATDLNGLELAAAYQRFDTAGGMNDIDTFGISAAYDFGQFELAADYSESDADIETDSVNAAQYNLAASFAATDDTDIALGMINTDFDDKTGNEDFVEYYANVTYKLPAHSNVSVFAEIKNTDLDDSDMGYLAGMRVKF